MKTTMWNSHLGLTPPQFGTQIPPPKPLLPQTFRELFINNFEFERLTAVTQSPFYAIGSLFRISHWCWNQVITKIREEDRRIKGISDDDISNVESISALLRLVQRGGSFQWHGADELSTKSLQTCLQEDFKSVLNQSDLIWQERDKMAAVAGAKAQTRRTTRLTNAFTFLYVIRSTNLGIYGGLEPN